MTPNPCSSDRIRELNDAFRAEGPGAGGRWVLTRGVLCLGADLVGRAVRAVQDFDRFEAGDDPYGERDFGSFTLCGDTLLWRIDYYDHDLERGAEDPADAAATSRVLTIMLAEEY